MICNRELVTHHSRLMTSPTQKSPSMSADMVTPAYVGSSPRSSQMLDTMCVGTRTCSQAQGVYGATRRAVRSADVAMVRFGACHLPIRMPTSKA
jgi:hypothetical protein